MRTSKVLLQIDLDEDASAAAGELELLAEAPVLAVLHLQPIPLAHAIRAGKPLGDTALLRFETA